MSVLNPTEPLTPNTNYPIRYDNGQVTIVTPGYNPITQEDRQLNQWVDSNFSHVYNLQTNRYISRMRSNQSPYINFTNKNITLTRYCMPDLSKRIYRPRGTSFRPLRAHWLNNNTFTNLNSDFVQALSSPIEMNIGFGFTISAYSDIVRNKRGAAREAARDILSQPIPVDHYGAISLLEDHPAVLELKQQFKNNAPEKLKGILLESIYRGKKPGAITLTTVTKQQVLDGRALFPYKCNIGIIEQKDNCCIQKSTVGLAGFLSLSKLLGYKKSRILFLEFLDDLQYRPLKIYDPETFTKNIEKYSNQFTKYWDNITKIIDFSSMKTSPKVFDTVVETLKSGKYAGNKTLKALSAKSLISKTAIGKQYITLKTALSRLEDNKKDANNKLYKTDQSINYANDRLRDTKDKQLRLEQEIARLNNTKIKLIEELSLITEVRKDTIANIEDITTHITNTLNDFAPVKIKFNQQVNKYIEQPSKVDLFNNMLKSGIVIQDIKVIDEHKTILSLIKHPELAANDSWSIHEMRLLTTKPSIIYVDRMEEGDNAKQVVGGPYEIRLVCHNNQHAEMSIRLANQKSVFGFKKNGVRTWNVKVHPHTNRQTIRSNIDDLDNFIHTWVSCCLGEVKHDIAKGLNNKDIRVVIASILSWISSCYTKDEWGAEYTWFPTPDEVNIMDPDIVTNPTPKPLLEPQPQVNKPYNLNLASLSYANRNTRNP